MGKQVRAIADKRYVVMTVECPRCRIEQKIYIAVRAGFGQMEKERIQCLNCDHSFKVTVTDRIIRGPFPA